MMNHHSIIVENDLTASKCIKFLKSNRFGTATFLPLNKIKPAKADTRAKELANKKGDHGFAIDLITYDHKFKNAFSHVFGNTLIVDDIETARRLGIGIARMVTLEGDLTESSGAMVGGFRIRKTGSFKEKNLDADISKANAELGDFESDIANLEKMRADNEQKIQTIREKKAFLEGEIIKKERALHLDSSDMEASIAYKEELQEQMKDVEEKSEKIDEKLVEDTQELTKLKIEKQQLRDQVNQIRKPTLLAELNAFDTSKRTLSEDRIKVEAELTHVVSQIEEMVSRDEENTKKILKDMGKEESAFKDEIINLETKSKKSKQEIKAERKRTRKLPIKIQRIIPEKKQIFRRN